MPNSKRPKIVYVKWNDAHSKEKWFKEKDFDNKKSRQWIVESAGILIKDDSEGIVLSPFTTKEWGERESRDNLVIPKSYIIEKRIL